VRRNETPEPIWIKFCTVVDIPREITYKNFGDHWLRGFGVKKGGEIAPFPMDFHRRPYNTLALPYRASVGFVHTLRNFQYLVMMTCDYNTRKVCLMVDENRLK